MLDRVLRRMMGLSGRLIASYVLVTLAVVVVVEAVVLGYQAPRLENETRLKDQVTATAQAYLEQLAQRYPPGTTPDGTLLGDPSQPARPGQAVPASGGVTLVIAGIAGPIREHRALTAAVLITPVGRILASSAPSRYPPGQPAARMLPAAAAAAIARTTAKEVDNGRTNSAVYGQAGIGAEPYGRVSWTLDGPTSPDKSGFVAYLYVQAPVSTKFVNPVDAWRQLREYSDTGPLLAASYVLLIVIVPVGVLFGLLTSRSLIRRVRRLEQATVAVADGDYTVLLSTSGRDEIGRLEANFTTMTRQLGSALSAERERATVDAAAAERARLAREIHDAISQHLFGLRMIAAGMRKVRPDDQQVQAIERISDDALRDMQLLLLELRPASLDGVGLTPALQEICAAYHDRLGVIVESDLGDVAVPGPVQHALLRITQEALTNAVRHGDARHLAVSVTRPDGHVELTVRDNGTGFDPTAPTRGSGLAHIRDRVDELGGTLEIASAPGRGTALTIRVPLP